MKVLVYGSLDFAAEIRRCADLLVAVGETVLLPDLHRYQHIRDQFLDHESFARIQALSLRRSADLLGEADAFVALVKPHRGFEGYVGGTSFCLLSLAFAQRKLRFLTGQPDASLVYAEELKAFDAEIFALDDVAKKWGEHVRSARFRQLNVL